MRRLAHRRGVRQEESFLRNSCRGLYIVKLRKCESASMGTR